MSETILGYDCQGEALRAGDRAECVHVLPQWRGDVVTIIAPLDDKRRLQAVRMGYTPDNCVILDDGRACHCPKLRLINSGRDLFDKSKDRALSEGDPDALPAGFTMAFAENIKAAYREK